MAMLDGNFDVDKLTYEIFSILENKFLFGGYDDPKLKQAPVIQQQLRPAKPAAGGCKVRILSIDGGSGTNGILAARSLAHLESCLRRKTGNPNASVADYFDVVAGSADGGILAALLFTRGKNNRPMFTAEEALDFMVKRAGSNKANGVLGKIFRQRNSNDKVFRRLFGDCSLKDTVKSVLIPCYDLSTRAPFLFSRADALEMDGYDFRMSDVCLATSADPSVVGAVEIRSVDKKTRIVAVDGGIAMNNPTAAAITHVLNNKQEFPSCNGVEDLLVVSLGNGDADFGVPNRTTHTPARFVRIAGDGASDMVDQAVSMAFGRCRTSNYVRIQANWVIPGKSYKKSEMLAMAEEMLAQKDRKSVV